MVNFFPRALFFRAVVIGQGQEREPLAMLEIARVKSIEKENESRYHQGEAEENQDDDHIHDFPFADRTAVRVTTARELAGMNTAAATGVTRPAAQHATATTL